MSRNITITKTLVEKTFIKVGEMAHEDLSLDTKAEQKAFISGFIDSMRKEAGMTPEQGLGFLKYLSDVGMLMHLNDQKNASLTEDDVKIQCEYIDEVFDDAGEKLAGYFGDMWEFIKHPVDTVTKVHGKAVGEAAGKTVIDGVEQKIKDYGNKAWDFLKSDQFLGNVAPLAIGAVGGYLLPKLFGGEGGVGTALLGAGAALGGKHLLDRSGLLDPATWEAWKNSASEKIDGLVGQPAVSQAPGV